MRLKQVAPLPDEVGENAAFVHGRKYARVASGLLALHHVNHVSREVTQRLKTFGILRHVVLGERVELVPVAAPDDDHLRDGRVLVQHVERRARSGAARDDDAGAWLVVERGVSVGAHTDGKVIDVFNALDGDGAFSPERAGGVPNGGLIDMCFSGKYTKAEVYKKMVGNGGFNAYCGTNDMRDVAKMVDGGDKNADLVRRAFIMQVAKDIGSMACVLSGKVDQIIITGGIAYDKVVVAGLKERAGFIAPITVYPGEDELLALVQGGLRVMNGEEKAMEY